MSDLADRRIDVCLWFLQAVSIGEVKEMMQLATQLPVIPILAKVCFIRLQTFFAASLP